MILDATFFVRKINLPQTGNTDGLADVESFISEYETEYLQKALGYPLWKAFTDGIAGSGAVDQRWTDLLDGAEFTHDSRAIKWPGFAAKPSPIAQYVYYMIQENEASDTVLVGTSTGDTDNATRKSPAEKMIAAWNKMVELNVLLWNFLNANRSTYPEWDYRGYYPTWYWPDHIGYCHRNPLFNRKNYLDL